MMRAFILLAALAVAEAGKIKNIGAQVEKSKTNGAQVEKSNIKPVSGDKVGLKLKAKKMTAEERAKADLANLAGATSTMAQTAKLLSQVFMPNIDHMARNLAARQYFRQVYHLPTTHQKMAATESFIQGITAFQMAMGRKPGTVERLTPNELEHWLTTEFLPEDFRDAGIGLTFMFPSRRLPAGIISRGPEFAAHFHNQTSCVATSLRDILDDGKLSFNYGTHCGATNEMGSLEGCPLAKRNVRRIQNDDQELCADGGTDACCAQHDLVRTGININELASFTSCKANNALAGCMAQVTPNKLFEDDRGISELKANAGAQCIYKVMPCLAQTRNRFYEINFKTKKAPMLRSLYPTEGDHHVQVVFPFDKSYGDDLTDESTVYRKSMKADEEYSHWKHIDPPTDVFGSHPSQQIEQDLANKPMATWDSIV